MTTSTVQWMDARSEADGFNDAMTALTDGTGNERC
jgi:hypothetical protein